MGCTNESIDYQFLRVATLNYSGILLSPYQFFASQSENIIISNYSETFAQVCRKQIPQFDSKDFKWNLGKIDQHWQQSRYAPIYNPTCGIKNSVYLVDKQQFEVRWDQAYERNRNELQTLYLKKNKKQNQRTQNQVLSELKLHIQNTKKFDMMCYKTLLKVIYHIDDIQKVGVNAKKYKQHQRLFFSKSFLKEEKKAKLIVQYLDQEKTDVLFLQQTTDKLVNQIQKLTDKYRISMGNQKIDNQLCKSVILIRQEKFPKLRTLKQQNNIFYRNYRKLNKKDTQQAWLTHQQLKQLNHNQDTVIQVVGNIIFLSVHLSSKQKLNQIQIQILKKTLYKLKVCFPSYHIICGGDLNGRFQFNGSQEDIGNQINMHGQMVNINDNSQIKQIIQKTNFNVYPVAHQGLTVNKKRTMMQAQRKKANILSNGVKDYIISDLQVLGGKVKTIKNKQINYLTDNIAMLPSQDHPYDHYLVSCYVKLNQQMNHNYQANILKKYNPKKLTKQQVQKLQVIQADE